VPIHFHGYRNSVSTKIQSELRFHQPNLTWR